MNTIVLICYNYSDRVCESSLNIALEKVEIFYTVFLIIEAIIKIIAMGFVFHRRSYLRNGWNALDFVILILSYLFALSFFRILDLFPQISLVYGYKTLRAIRPLKIAYTYKGMKDLLDPLMEAIKKLPTVLLFLCFLLLLFSLLGVHQFQGAFYNR